ncbi:hypothetical protein INT45_012353 [Circinella minor]|uniref:Uncharacterized protein n=1 Tax=Circinella minor TaxID=1195481 RepID=A0A8H7VI12_9FUNG|nr:hypothetical protein INT45_012353 [Circinella minor]
MTQEHSPGMLKDIFEGSVYKELKPNLLPNQSMDALDLAISLFIDGFSPFNGGNSKITIVHIVFLSLPPNERYKKKNMLQVSIILADHTGNLYSFLKPLMNELFSLENAGMEVKFRNGSVKVKTVSSISPTGRENRRYYIGSVDMPEERSNDEFKYGNEVMAIEINTSSKK